LARSFLFFGPFFLPPFSNSSMPSFSVLETLVIEDKTLDDILIQAPGSPDTELGSLL